MAVQEHIHARPLNLVGQELRNFRPQALASDPDPALCRFYLNTTTGRLRYYDGDSWEDTGLSYTAGVGLTLTGADLSVNVDDSSIEINSDTLRVKALGITNAMLAGSIANSKLATDPLARANHTGTQVAATISNFDTQVRTSRLDQMAVPTAAVNLNTNKITNLGAPTVFNDAATKQYVDNAIAGVKWGSVRVASTANFAGSPSGNTLTLAGTSYTMDGVALATGDRVLLKNQTNPAYNGIYDVLIGGSVGLTRAVDMDAATDVDGHGVVVEDGAQAGTLWVTTSEVTAINTDAINWVQFNSVADIVAGLALSKTGTTLDVLVDNVGIEINSDALRLKDLGVTLAKMAANSVDSSKIVDESVDFVELTPAVKRSTPRWANLAALSNVNIASPGGGLGALAGDRVLLMGQTTASQNGLWVFNGDTSAMTRPADWATGSTILPDTRVRMFGGEYRVTTGSNVVVGTNNIAFTRVTIFTNDIEDDAITVDKMADNSVQNSHLVGSISFDKMLTVADGGVPASGTTASGNTAVARIKKFDINGDASKVAWTLTHNLNTRKVMVQTLRWSGGNPFTDVDVSWTVSSLNAIIMEFPTAPAVDEIYTIVVTG